MCETAFRTASRGPLPIARASQRYLCFAQASSDVPKNHALSWTVSNPDTMRVLPWTLLVVVLSSTTAEVLSACIFAKQSVGDGSTK